MVEQFSQDMWLKQIVICEYNLTSISCLIFQVTSLFWYSVEKMSQRQGRASYSSMRRNIISLLHLAEVADERLVIRFFLFGISSNSSEFSMLSSSISMLISEAGAAAEELLAAILNEPADFRGKQLTKNYHELSYAWSNERNYHRLS